MLDDINIEKYWQKTLEWCEGMFWTTNTLYQGIVILAAFFVAAIIYPAARAKLDVFLNKTNFPAAVDNTISNLRRLIFPIIALTMTVIGAKIVSIESIGVDTTLLEIVTKLLFAWIVIRIVVQFIGNAAMRSFFAFVTWSIAALSIFGVLEQTMETLNGIGFAIGDSKITMLAVINSILLIVALLYFALFGSSFAERKIKNVKSLTRTSQVLISKVVRVALIVFALLIGVTSAGIDLSLFAVFGGAIGLGIGFGLQKGISNLFSGMLLLMDRSIKPGDVIEIPDIGTFGWVNNMAARYTEIVTRDNKSFLIPNEDFITQRVVNWSHGNSLIRLQVSFGVHYKSDPHVVKDIAEKATKEAHERIAQNPSPVCHMTEFGDSSLNFSLRFWIKDAEQGVTNIKGQVMLALWDTFKENDIEIPYPHREVYIHEGN
ncbi:MAG: mechanosensitive ion channel family protein [Bdellovibrionales bacterium]